MRSPDLARRLSAIGTPDLSEIRWCIGLFIAIALPAFLAMACFLGPFQGADETPHFLRAVQISDGQLTPEVRSGHAGATLDSGVVRLGGYYQYLMYGTGGRYGESADDRRAAWQQRPAGTTTFAAFSNTVIYFPLAHALPAAAIAFARAVGTPPMGWLYAGRIAGVLVAIALYVIAMMIFPQGRALIFVIGLMPRTIFSTAAISADTLIIPLSTVFAALAYRLWRDGRLGFGYSALLVFSTFYVCVNKLAYVPLLAAPPLLALSSKRRDWAYVGLLTATGVCSLVIWAAWMKTISHDVFSIRPGYHPDIYAQLRQILTRPNHDVHVAVRTFKHHGAMYLNSLVGGSFSVSGPLAISAVSISRKSDILLLIALTICALYGKQRQQLLFEPFAVSTLLVFACFISIFILIYMQFNNPGADYIDGVQGRYFLPLLPIAFAFTPKVILSRRVAAVVTVASTALLALIAVKLVVQEHSYYEAFRPLTGLRYARPFLTWLE